MSKPPKMSSRFTGLGEALNRSSGLFATDVTVTNRDINKSSAPISSFVEGRSP